MSRTIMFAGHRDCFTDYTSMQRIINLYKDDLWIYGGAKGFDTQVQSFAREYHICTKIFVPDYATYPPKIAPLIRNKEMLTLCDLVVACYDGRKTGGTYFVISEAIKAGKQIIYVPANKK